MTQPLQFTISDLAREFDLTTRAIRFYEDMGLLQPQRAGPGGRNRIYSARDRTRLKLTLRAKRLGLSLTEAREIIDMYDSPRDTGAQLKKFLACARRRTARPWRNRWQTWWPTSMRSRRMSARPRPCWPSPKRSGPRPDSLRSAGDFAMRSSRIIDVYVNVNHQPRRMTNPAHPPSAGLRTPRTVRARGSQFPAPGHDGAPRGPAAARGPGLCEILELPYSDKVTQQQGGFHGGAMGALADIAGGYAALTVAPEGMEVTTVEYKINFPAGPARAATLHGHGPCRSGGKRIIVTVAEVVHVAEHGVRSDCALMQQTLVPVPMTTDATTRSGKPISFARRHP
jgi:uncharacterized protein (TIGR00369 family)